MDDERRENGLSDQLGQDIQGIADKAGSAKNAYNKVKDAQKAAQAGKAAKAAHGAAKAAQSANAAKNAAKGVAKFASGNVAGAAIDAIKASPQLMKAIAAILVIVLIVQAALPSLIWGKITDWSNSSDKASVAEPDDVAGSGEALVDELLDEILLCSKKSQKKAQQIADSIEEQKDAINSKCESIFKEMDGVSNAGTTYDPNVDGDRKISSVTKVRWGGTELNVDSDAPITFYQANKIIAAYNVASGGYVDDPDHDKPYAVSGTKDNSDKTDQIGSLADWLGNSVRTSNKYITFNIGGSDGVKCYTKAWKGTFLPQYLTEQMVQEVENGTYDADYYSDKGCSLLDMLMVVSGPATLGETISVDVTKELKSASYTETSVTYTREEVTHYYKQTPIIKDGKFAGWKTIEITDPGEIAAGHYSFSTTRYENVEHKTSKTVNYQYWEYTYIGSAKVNVSIGVKDFGGIANSIGLWAGSLDDSQKNGGGL